MAVAYALSYRVLRTVKQPGIGGKWNSPDREHAEDLAINHFCQDSLHAPATELKMLYDAECLYGVFRVQDRYVLCRETEYQADVTQDACVAAYLQPRQDGGYLALEMNCCGTLRARFIDAPSLQKGTLPGRITDLPWKEGYKIRIFTSQFGNIDPEVHEPLTWYLEFVIPFALFKKYVDAAVPAPGDRWFANFHKCASSCSHPHRASWAPLTEGVSFHQTDSFAPLYFD